MSFMTMSIYCTIQCQMVWRWMKQKDQPMFDTLHAYNLG